MTEAYCQPKALALSISFEHAWNISLHFSPGPGGGTLFSLFFFSSSWGWLVSTMKYCRALQMYFRCAMQPSDVRLMMFFTSVGNLVIKLRCITHCSIKLYYETSCPPTLTLPMFWFMPSFNDCYRYTQNQNSTQCFWMQICMLNEWLPLRCLFWVIPGAFTAVKWSQCSRIMKQCSFMQKLSLLWGHQIKTF